MKFTATAHHLEDATPVALEASVRVVPDQIVPAVSDDSSTRDRVCRQVLEQGPVTATVLAASLGLTPAAVRRHLDGLVEEGLVTAWTPPRGSDLGHRGRGRPARSFVLTDAGHAAMATSYDDLATAALQYLEEIGGPEAVRGFAVKQVQARVARYRPAVEAAGTDPQRRTLALAEALSADGYAATTRTAPGVEPQNGGTQLCQAHCPVQHVAERFPQLCDAETEAFSGLLGIHVQRLATVPHGAHVCTTYVPAGDATGTTTDLTAVTQERNRR